MVRILQSLLALIGLLLLALMAARANSAPLQETDTARLSVSTQPAAVAAPRLLPGHRCLVPGPQPGTHLQGQPYAYGYFGARAQPAAVYHNSHTADWYQWSFYRAD